MPIKIAVVRASRSVPPSLLCLILLLLLVILAVFASPSLAQTTQKITLRLTDWADLDEMPLDKQAIAEFHRRYPSIEILYEPNPGRQYEEKILTALAVDDPPDVFLLDSKLIPTFTNKKVLLDLSPSVRELGIDTAQWFPNVLDIARRGSALYAFPKGFTPLMIYYYNKSLFDAAHLPYPTNDWTWDDYLVLAKLLTKDNVAPNTGSWVQSEKTGVNTELFADGRIGMMMDGHWRMPRFLRQIEQGKLRIGVVAPPQQAGVRKVNVMYESGWCVPINTRHPREAALLAAFLAGEAPNRLRASRRLEIPSTIKVAQEMVAEDTLGLEKAFVDEVPFCRQPWGTIVERFSEAEWTLQDAVDEVMINRKPMHETMTKYAAKVDEQLENIREHQRAVFKPIRTEREILWFLLAVAGAAALASGAVYFKAKRRARKAAGAAIGFLAPSLIHLYFLPSVTSFVAIALVWMWIYHPTFGVANYLLSLLHLGPLQWLNSTDTAMFSIIVFSVWLGLGYQMVIYLAGLQGIPEELLDAARIDGAGSWHRFGHVTFPLLKPTTFFILVTSFISSFQVFTSIYVMTAGGDLSGARTSLCTMSIRRPGNSSEWAMPPPCPGYSF